MGVNESGIPIHWIVLESLGSTQHLNSVTQVQFKVYKTTVKTFVVIYDQNNVIPSSSISFLGLI